MLIMTRSLVRLLIGIKTLLRIRVFSIPTDFGTYTTFGRFCEAQVCYSYC